MVRVVSLDSNQRDSVGVVSDLSVSGDSGDTDSSGVVPGDGVRGWRRRTRRHLNLSGTSTGPWLQNT